jgi:hypothetical protein
MLLCNNIHLKDKGKNTFIGGFVTYKPKCKKPQRPNQTRRNEYTRISDVTVQPLLEFENQYVLQSLQLGATRLEYNLFSFT